MGSLANKQINESFDGLIKTSDENTLPLSGRDKLQDGTGVDSSISVGRDGEGIAVGGDIEVTGTVDGRDVAADGQKLDGIEAGATADQTAAEIKTAYESNLDTNAFTDAEQSKLAGIEAGAEVNVTPNLDQVTTEGNSTTNDVYVGSVKTELVESISNPLVISSQSGFAQMNLNASIVQTTAVNATNEYKLNSSTIVDQNENLTIQGWADIDGDLNIDGGDLTSNQATFNLLNSGVTTVNAFSQANNVNMGVGTTEFFMSGSAEVTGGLTVDGNYNTADGNIYSTTGSLSLGSGSVSAGGSVTGSSIVKTGGASTEFLKADGTVDSTTYQDTTEKGQANGYAPLDSGAKITEAYLPDSIVGQVEYKGTWNASTNTPALPQAPDPAPKGHYYIVSVAGTFESVDYSVGDWIIGDGTSWSKVDNSDAVNTVFGRLGNVVANESDYSSFYPLKADIKDATITVTTGGGLSGSGDFTTNQATNETITIQHADTSSQASVDNPTNTFIQDVTLDTYGHVTGLVSQAVSIPSPENATITIAAGTAMSGGGDFTTNQATNETITINHADTSTLSGTYGSSANSTKIDTITVDANGHITAITTGATGDIDGVTAGSGLTGGGTSGTVTVSHADTSSQGNVNNSGGTVIQDITLDTYGHITGIGSANLDSRYLSSSGGTLDAGTNTTLDIKCNDDGQAMIRLTGDSQGTGIVEVGQSVSYGGGMYYNGDGSPTFISGEKSDYITFYRNAAGSKSIVFEYPYSSNTVNFKAVPTINDQSLDDRYVKPSTTPFLNGIKSYSPIEFIGFVAPFEVSLPLSITQSYAGPTNVFAGGTFDGIIGTTQGIYSWAFSPTGYSSSDYHWWSLGENGPTGVPYIVQGSYLGDIPVYGSDYRIKQDIKDLPDGAIERVMKLRPVSFRMKGEHFDETVQRDGFIAHEVQESIPNGASYEKDSERIQSLQLDGIVAQLTKAVQEQQVIIEGLKSEIEQLKLNN